MRTTCSIHSLVQKKKRNQQQQQLMAFHAHPLQNTETHSFSVLLCFKTQHDLLSQVYKLKQFCKWCTKKSWRRTQTKTAKKDKKEKNHKITKKKTQKIIKNKQRNKAKQPRKGKNLRKKNNTFYLLFQFYFRTAFTGQSGKIGISFKFKFLINLTKGKMHIKE